jgi:hypothetical protein
VNLKHRRSLTILLGVTGVAALFAVTVRAAAPAGRYTVVSGSIVDGKTGLIWQGQADSATYTSAVAGTTCQALNCGGFASGWRVPTLKELQTLIDWRAGSTTGTPPVIDTTAFPGPYAAGDVFWTSADSVSSPGYKWVVSFAYGNNSALLPGSSPAAGRRGR